MKLCSVLGLTLAASCCVCSSAVNPWTRRKDEEKKGGFEAAVERQQQPPADPLSAMQGLGGSANAQQLADLVSLLQVASPEELMQTAKETVSAVVDFLSNKEQRKELADPLIVTNLLAQMPQEARNMPEVKAVLDVFDDGKVGTMNTAEFQKQMDEAFDKALDAAREVQTFLNNPKKLPSFLNSALEQMNITDAEKDKFIKTISDPKELGKAMSDFVVGLTSGLDSLLSATDPDALAQNMQQLMQDPELKAALDDPEVTKLMEELMADPSKMQELFGSMLGDDLGAADFDQQQQQAAGFASSRARRTAEQQQPARRHA